jgi:hypothetical protein
MLNNILSQAVLRQVRTEIPDARLLPYGGPWNARAPDAPADHNELVEFDRGAVPAADLLATGANSRDVADRPFDVVMYKAFRIKSSSRLTTSDLERLMAVVSTGGAIARDRQALLPVLRRHMEKRLQSVAITRGILLAGMAQGELSWDRFGYKIGPIDFDMPSTLKLVPSVYWRSNVPANNATATPVSDMIALDQAAEALGGAPYDAVDMGRTMFNAMLATDEYQDQAKALSSVYQAGSLPVAGSEAAIELANRVVGKRITITDQTYELELIDGSRTSGRYLAEKYAVLYRLSEVGAGTAYDFANCPVTESAVAAIAEDGAFGGDVVRGPVNYTTHDRQEFAWVRMHGTQEGTPRRLSRTATARILVQQP